MTKILNTKESLQRLIAEALGKRRKRNQCEDEESGEEAHPKLRRRSDAGQHQVKHQ